MGAEPRARWARMSFSENNGPAEAVTAKASIEKSAILILNVVGGLSKKSVFDSSNDNVEGINTHLLGLPNGGGQYRYL